MHCWERRDWGISANGFPTTIPSGKGPTRIQFVTAAAAEVRKLGWHITNLDCTIFAQQPKLLAYKPGIRESLARVLDLDPELVNVKAKTGERVGPIGREEAICRRRHRDAGAETDMSVVANEDRFEIDPGGMSAWEARVRRWLWPLLGLTAWAVFELTSELWASTLVLCAHYAWIPISHGLLAVVERPWKQRGRCSLLAYAGHGVGRMVLAGIIIVIFLSPLTFQNPAIEGAVIAAAVVQAVGLLLMVLLLWIALFLARLQGVKLWVNSQVHRSWRGEWPPSRTGIGNRITSGFWVSSCLGFPVIATAVFMPMVIHIPDPGHQSLATIGFFLGSFVLIAMFYCIFARHAFARSNGDVLSPGSVRALLPTSTASEATLPAL